MNLGAGGSRHATTTEMEEERGEDRMNWVPPEPTTRRTQRLPCRGGRMNLGAAAGSHHATALRESERWPCHTRESAEEEEEEEEYFFWGCLARESTEKKTKKKLKSKKLSPDELGAAGSHHATDRA